MVYALRRRDNMQWLQTRERGRSWPSVWREGEALRLATVGRRSAPSVPCLPVYHLVKAKRAGQRAARP